MTDTENKIHITANVLRAAATVFMVIDHAGRVFLDFMTSDTAWRICIGLGRLSFPIFAFLVSVGAVRTSDRGRYCGRLFFWALISEIPYRLVFWRPYSPGSIHNVIFTLAAGLLAIVLSDLVKSRFEGMSGNLLAIAVIAGCCLLTYLARSDYLIMGVLLIYTFYRFRGDRVKQIIYGIPVMLAGTFLMYAAEGFDTWESMSLLNMQYPAVFAFILIWLYDGTGGKRMPPWTRYFFYPGHLLILYFLSRVRL